MPVPRLHTCLPAGNSPHARDYPVFALCQPDGSVVSERDGGGTREQRADWAAALRKLANQLVAEAPSIEIPSTEPAPADAP
jgi:hypothetical protein